MKTQREHDTQAKGFPGGSAGKESTCNVGDLGSIPGLGRSPGEGKDYPLQYFGLENSPVHGKESVTTDQSSFAFTRSWERGKEQILAQSSEGTNSTDPLITDVQPQELSENKLLLFKLCSCGTFIQQLHETNRSPI